MNLKDFHGVVSKCHCTNPAIPDNCKNCFSRGFTAVCLQCSGTGQVKVPVAGAASGDMKSTCDKCGGMGHFGVPKPANGDAEHPVQDETKPAKAETTEEMDETKEFQKITAGAAEVPEDLARSIHQDGKIETADPMMEAVREMQSEPELPELKRPVSVHWKKWGKMTRDQQLSAIEEASKPAEELVTA